MRDLETTRIAIETAETGHLVFGTLHTSTASSTVDRIINQFSADEQEQIRMMLAGSLRGVVAQNLLKKKGGGRVAALEILMVTAGVAANIREGKTYQIPSAMQIGGKYGMQLLNDTLEKLVKSDQVDAMIAYDKSLDKEDMAKKLKALGHDVEAQLFANEKAAAAAPTPAPGTPKSEPKLQAMGGDQKPKPPLAQPSLGGHPPGHTEPPKPGGPPSGWKK
jgi:twitching motility protein PilT